MLLEAGADPETGSSCSECALNRGFRKISKMFEQRLPGCVEGFIFDSSAIFIKWLRRYFVVSLPHGVLSVSENLRSAWDSRSIASNGGSAVTRLAVRNCCLGHLQNFEGKQGVIKIRCLNSSEVFFLALSSKFSTELMSRWLNMLGARPFSADIDSSPSETSSSVHRHAGIVADLGWLQSCRQTPDASRVPLLSSSNV